MDLAEISSDLKNLSEKCYIAQSVRVSSGFREKIRDQTAQIEFLRRKPVTDRRSSRVGLGPVGFTGWVGPLVEMDTPRIENMCGKHCLLKKNKTTSCFLHGIQLIFS